MCEIRSKEKSLKGPRATRGLSIAKSVHVLFFPNPNQVQNTSPPGTHILASGPPNYHPRCGYYPVTFNPITLWGGCTIAGNVISVLDHKKDHVIEITLSGVKTVLPTASVLRSRLFHICSLHVFTYPKEVCVFIFLSTANSAKSANS